MRWNGQGSRWWLMILSKRTGQQGAGGLLIERLGRRCLTQEATGPEDFPLDLKPRPIFVPGRSGTDLLTVLGRTPASQLFLYVVVNQCTRGDRCPDRATGPMRGMRGELSFPVVCFGSELRGAIPLIPQQDRAWATLLAWVGLVHWHLKVFAIDEGQGSLIGSFSTFGIPGQQAEYRNGSC